MFVIVGVKGTPFCTELDHVCVMAPEALSETVLPRHVLVVDWVTVRTGTLELTVMLTCLVAVQLCGLVAVSA